MPEIQAIPGFFEPVSSLTHLVGALVFLALSVPMLRHFARSRRLWTALGLFSFSVVFMLSMSGVYHLLDEGGVARPVLRRLDHVAIFVLIAGTLTAVHTVLMKGPWRWVMITVAWIACALGVALKVLYFDETPEWVALAVYLGMGWLGFISTMRLWYLHGPRYIAPLIAGGMLYTVGAVLDFLRAPVLIPGVVHAHELFHVCVLAALGLHWAFVSRVLREQRALSKV
ncbi:MAG: channel protein (hemolysin III family) [Pseudohongiellaceae bacterium]|jgi:channel protein (hemolysin III family)